jgi:septal ring factor EnvC (AmiA/AmiB activator)
MQEFPDIPISDSAKRASNTVQSTRSVFPTVAVGIAVVSSILTLVICASMVMMGGDSIKSLFGFQEEPKVNPLVHAIEEIKATQVSLAAEIDSLKESLAQTTSSVNEHSMASSTLETRTKRLEQFVTALEDSIKEQKKQILVVQKEKQKVAVAKVQAEKTIPLILMSIRQQAGLPSVALRDGLDISELLMPGDSWRGWTFLDADPRTKSARFQVNGKPQELRL